MSDLKDTDVIEQQYTEHPYPAPISNMSESELDKVDIGKDLAPDELWHKLFPREKRTGMTLNILVAGCGTNQAVYHAMSFPNSHHYAIDVSDVSLNHVREHDKEI